MQWFQPIIEPMKNSFWREAARGGVIVGIVAVVTVAAKTWLPSAFIAFSLVELFVVAYCIYAFGRRRTTQVGEQTYGQCMKFVLATMLMAGLIYGVGYYFLVNQVAVDFYTQAFERTFDQMDSALKQMVDKDYMYRVMANPLYWLFYGVLAMLIYGGLVGLFVVSFIRKR